MKLDIPEPPEGQPSAVLTSTRVTALEWGRRATFLVPAARASRGPQGTVSWEAGSPSGPCLLRLSTVEPRWQPGLGPHYSRLLGVGIEAFGWAPPGPPPCWTEDSDWGKAQKEEQVGRQRPSLGKGPRTGVSSQQPSSWGLD